MGMLSFSRNVLSWLGFAETGKTGDEQRSEKDS